VAAHCEPQAPCPTCKSLCDVEPKKRLIMSIDGPVELTESVANCHKCERNFFPSASDDGTG
jgi:hypothetical protein